MAKTNNKPEQAVSSDKATRTKRTYSKEVMARARKIQAARKAEENKKAAEERKVRMAKRVEDKKKVAEAKKSADAKQKAAKPAPKSDPAVKPVAAPTPAAEKPAAEVVENEIVDFAITARKYKTYLTRKFKERKFWVDPSPFEILSYIPGTVISVDVKAGRVVEEGKQILILEAMKMQNKVEMPFTARIKKINVKAGEKIPKDFVMIELEPIEK